MTDFLLELRSEEIPARMQDRAREDLAKLFAAELARAGLGAAETITYATPRRLALIARGLPTETAATAEELKGPRTSAPSQALEGFLRKTGLSQGQLTERDGIWYAVIDTPGRATAAVLGAAIPAIVRAFPWPKAMRWGAASASTESLRWVRPLHGIVALFGDDVVPCEIAGMPGASPGKVGTGFPSGDATIKSSAATKGHRFHHPGDITIGSAGDYVEKLRACHVIVDQDERRAIIRDRAAALAAEAGLALIEDEGLVAENAGLTEWPVPLLGRFDAAFLDVPPEVIQLTARVNQKYFVCRTPFRNREEDRREAVVEGLGSASPAPPSSLRDATSPARGGLANAFICTANIDAVDGGAKIVEGNRKVLAARLADARFFYETDLKVPLEEQAKKLEKIVFHEKLGTVADKVDRVAKLARWLVEEGIIGTTSVIPAKAGIHSRNVGDEAAGSSSLDSRLRGNDDERAKLAALAERAARLCKADLVTGMVGEFPELQGVMGGYYAAAQGEDPRVAAAIRDHYKPVGQGDDVPTAPVTVAVSLADKLDTITGFFVIGQEPTGSKDPFALRRAALGIIRLILDNKLYANLESLTGAAYHGLFESTLNAYHYYDDQKIHDVTFFLADRLKVQQREAGVRHDLIDAVFALGGEDDLVRLLARVRALQSFVGTEDGANLLSGYKRAANILKKEGYAAAPAVTPAEAGAQTRGGGDEAGTSASLDSRLRGNDGVGGSSLRGNDDAGHSRPRENDGIGAPGQNPLSYTPEKDEAALIAALDAAAPAAKRAVEAEDFEAAMAALATLRAPIDAFFDSVTVNDPDPEKRAARLALLARVRDAVHGVADFSKIEG